VKIDKIPTEELHLKFSWKDHLEISKESQSKNLCEWTMENDDAPILRYIYRNYRPKRHLEFGTWQGAGVVLCVEECDATIWTINLPFGETNEKNINSYGHYQHEYNQLKEWADKVSICKPNQDKEISCFSRIKSLFIKKTNNRSFKTDSIGFIGRKYIEKDYGHRVCQIYSDSNKWDTLNYPKPFFDSVLIDGGHKEEIVSMDMHKGLELLNSGGLLMFHDFCLDQTVLNKFPNVSGVYACVKNNLEFLRRQMSELFWIYPSWILLGIKK
jgi:predicted O-methyltransferase YrrM